MTSDLHDLTDRELYRLSFDIAEVLVTRAKCRLAGEAGIPAPVAMVRRMAGVSVGGEEVVCVCPECGEEVWDVATGSKLAKCWNTHAAYGGGTLAFDTMTDEDCPAEYSVKV